jgi:hypothetical protein
MNAGFLGELTLEKWHKLAPGTQYKYILLARQVHKAGGSNYLQSIGVPLESSLKTLQKAHEDYLHKTNSSKATGTDERPILISEQSGNRSPDFEHTTQESIAQSSQPATYTTNRTVTSQQRIDHSMVNPGELRKDSEKELVDLRNKIHGLEEYIKYLEYLLQRCQIEMKQRSEIFEIELRFRDQSLARLTAQLHSATL